MPHLPRSVAERIGEQARRRPEAMAVVGRKEQLTYAELDRRANRIAQRLRETGVGPEVRVGVSLRREPNLVAALLGVLRAGGAYVALDPAYPRERLDWMIADASPAVVLTHELLQEMLAGEWTARDRGVRVSGENLAYVLYTSGSTGRPKGVGVRHRSVAALMDWAGETFDEEELSGVLAATSVCFDLSVFELFAPLSRGGRVILAEQALELRDLPVRDSVRLINTVPSAIGELLRLEAVPVSVRTVNLAGEPLREALVRQILERTQARRVLNLYGPTEDTTYSTVAEVREGEAPPIGKPLPGSRAHVLDARMELVPTGVAGELYLGGEGLVRGYLGRPDLTAERFVPDAYGDEPGGRLYRTGDICRYRDDGELEYLGRADDQVKIRGFRIELGEVEAALASHPGVRQAAVVAGEEPDGSGLGLVAYVAADGMGAEQLRSWLGERLPGYMVPSVFVAMAELPVTASGKVDRRALAARGAVAGAASAGYEAPRTGVEEALAGIWAEVLGIERVGVRDNFFTLGGHSLRASQVTARVRRTLGVELPLAEVFAAPELAELGRRVEALLGERKISEALVATGRRGPGPGPLSYAQERVLFIEQLHPGTRAYHIPVGWWVKGKLEPEALEWSINALVRRHEALRTSFEVRNGEPVPVVWPEARVKLESVEAAQRAFDLTGAPLLRAGLNRMAHDEYLFVLNVHHLVCDGWSLAVLLEELGGVYEARLQGQTPELPPVGVQYGDYAAWQRQQRWDEGLRYWERRLAGSVGVLMLPAGGVRPAVETLRGSQRWYGLPPELRGGLREVGRSRGATEYMVLLAGFVALLHRYTGQEDIVVGTPAGGRSHAELERTVGLFANTLALRMEVTGRSTFRELLGQVRSRTVEGLAHQDVPFEQVVQRLRPVRDLSRNPLFQVMFDVHDAEARELRLASLDCKEVPVEVDASRVDLTVDVRTGTDALDCWVEYRTDLYSDQLIKGLVADFSSMLRALSTSTEERVRAVQISPPRVQQPGTGSADAPLGGAIRQQALASRHAQLTPERRALLQRRLSEL